MDGRVPQGFSLAQCAISFSRKEATIREWVYFKGNFETIREVRLAFRRHKSGVAIDFWMVGKYLAYAMDTGGGPLEEAEFGRSGIANALCGSEPPQSVVGQAVFALEVRPAVGAKRAVSKRILSVTLPPWDA